MKNETAIVEVIMKGQQPNATMKEMERSAAALRAQLRKLPADSAEFAAKSEELRKVNSRLASIRQDLKGTGGMFQWLGQQIKAIGILAVAALGFSWLTGKVHNIIQGNAELSDSLADVRKTTGMTEAEARKLNLTLSQLDTRTATKDLRQIAIAAGQLGIAKNDILRFTAATDKMVVSLGDEFTGGATEVTKVMGGLRNIFQDIKTDRIDNDMLRIGNAVNVLASQGAATGPVMTDFANRIGGVGISLGLSSAQVLGLSATLQELNVGTEKGGTAVVKILQRMTTHVSEFAAVANMDVKDFANLVNTDLFGAFKKVIESSKKSGSSATALGAILDKLGVEGAGASEVVTKLGVNMNLLTSKVDVAGKALQGTDSIMNEFRLKNKTLGAEMERLGKGLAGAFTNSTISDALNKMVGWMADLFDKTKKVSESMKDEQVTVNALVIELKEANTTNERRKEIYEDLTAINKKLVEGLDKENISIEKLNENLKIYNEQQQHRILIQKKQEEIDEQAEESADKLAKRIEAENKAREQLIQILDNQAVSSGRINQINDNTSLSLLEKLKQIQSVLKSIALYNGTPVQRDAYKFYSYLLNTINDLEKAEKKHNEETQKGVDLLKQKMDLEDKFAGDNEKRLDYSKKTEKELYDIIKQNILSKGFLQKQAAAATEELQKRANAASKNTNFIDEDAVKKAKQHAEEIKRIYEALKKDLQDLRHENSIANLTEFEKEQDKIITAQEEMRDRIMKDEKMGAAEKQRNLMFLEGDTQQKLRALQLKYQHLAVEEKKAFIKEYNSFIGDERQNEINEAQSHYDKLMEQAKDDANKQIALKQALEQKLKEIDQKYSIHPETKPAEKIDYSKKAYEYVQYAKTVQAFSNSLHQANNQRVQAEMEDLDRKTDYDLQKEQRLLDMKLISQKQYDDRVKKIETEKQNREKVERQRMAAQEKSQAEYNIALNTAEAITQIWSKHAATPVTAAALTLLTLGTAAAQLSIVANTPPPKYATGGYHFAEPGGYVHGETVFNSSTGTPFIAGEAGAEWIAPNWMMRQPVTANIIGMLEATRKAGRVYAGGGSTETQSSGSSSAAPGNNYSYDRLCALIEGNIALMKDLRDNGVDAKLSYDLFNKGINSIQNSKSKSAIS